MNLINTSFFKCRNIAKFLDELNYLHRTYLSRKNYRAVNISMGNRSSQALTYDPKLI